MSPGITGIVLGVMVRVWVFQSEMSGTDVEESPNNDTVCFVCSRMQPTLQHRNLLDHRARLV